MAAERDPYQTPRDWKPKSSFFRLILQEAAEKARHKQVTLPCPSCGETVVIDLSTPPPKT